MAYLGTFKVNTNREFMKFENVDGVDITFTDDTTYVCQVQGGKVLVCLTDTAPAGGYLIEQDEGFAFTPKDGKTLWIKNVASTDVHITISD